MQKCTAITPDKEHMAHDENNPDSLGGRVAMVTGSSSGIGRAIAIELARAGADVIVHARSNLKGAEETAHVIRSFGRKAHLLVADLSEIKGQDDLIAAAWDWLPIDIWVNNAGADVLTGSAAKY